VLGSGGIAPPFLTSALDGGDWSASRPGRFTPGTQCLWGCLGPTSGLETLEKRNISCPCLELNPGRPARSPSLNQLSYPDSCNTVRAIESRSLKSAVHEICCIQTSVLYCFQGKPSIGRRVNCCWPSPAKSFLVPSPAGLMTNILL
jgi:hypothetical protein